MNVFKTDGSKSAGTVALSDRVFGIEPNTHLIYQAVRVFLANQRQGTHKAKERAEVSGGGKKPWRQKGRGTARAGSSRSPLWVGGGTIFGPRPRDYSMKLPKKMKQHARRSAFALKARDEQIMIVEDFSVQEPRTREVAGILKALALDKKKTLLLVPKYDEKLWKAGRNIPNLNILEAAKVSTYEVLNNQVLLIQRSALPVIDETFTLVK
jgi:large subunit ribosomal protein L4